ncbi:MAG: hypothetical protein AAF799_14225 [Myxococcota bacterium]
MTDGERIPIVLCCAADRELSVAAVADALMREGHAPQVLPGVEADEALVAEATDRLRGAALFVLCSSEALGRAALRRLEGLFSARRGPMHRLVTVDVPARRPTTVVPEILDAVAELRHGAVQEEEDDGRFMRDVVIPTSVAAVPTASDRRLGGRGGMPGGIEEPRGISGEALGLGEDTEIVDPVVFRSRAARRVPEPTVPVDTPTPIPSASPMPATAPTPDLSPMPAGFEPEVQIATDPTTGEMTAVPESDGVPLPVAEDFPMVGGSSPDVAVRGAPEVRNWDPSGPVEVERVAMTGRADPRAETDDRPLPSASTPIDIGPVGAPPQPAPEQPRGSALRVVLLLFAAIGMAGVVGMAVMHGASPRGGGGRHQSVPQRGLPPEKADGEGEAGAEAADSAAAAAADAGAAADAASAAGAEPAPAGSSGDARAAGSTASEAATGEEPTSEGGGSTGGDAATDDGGTDEASTGAAAVDAPPKVVPDPPAAPSGTNAPMVPPPPSASPTIGQVDATIAAALDDGRLQEIDGLLVLPTGGGTMTWDEAANRCRRRKVESVRGWRLPSKGQLVALRKEKMLGGGSYWSRSVVGGDEVYAIDSSSGRLNVWLKIEPNAKAICVRKRP